MLLLASGTAFLRAQQVPSLTTQPVSQRVVAGHAVHLVTRAQPSDVEFQWFRDGVLLSGEEQDVLGLKNVTAGDEGFYKAIAKLPGGACWSREVFVQVDTPTPAPGVLSTDFYTDRMTGTSVDAILPLEDGRIVIGGKFHIGKAIRNLAVLLPDGSPDPKFSPTSYPDKRVWALTLSDGRLIAGGEFTSINGNDCYGIAAFDLDSGALAHDWDHSLGFVRDTVPVPRVLTLATDTAGYVVAGGTFTRWRIPGGEREQNWLVRIDAAGEPDLAYPTSPVRGAEVRDVAALPGGRLAVVGDFVEPSRRFAVLESTGYPTNGFALSYSPDDRVRAVLPLPDGTFLIGGEFDNIGNHLAHYDEDGTLVPDFTTGAGNTVNTLALAAGGAVLVGGVFTTVDGVPLRRIARLDAEELRLDSSFAAHGLDDEVQALAACGADVIVGGDFERPHQLLVKLLGSGEDRWDDLQFERAPLPRPAVIGAPLDLKVAVSPPRPDLAFRWLHDGVVIPDATGAKLSIDRVAPEDAGLYQVEVSDPGGTTIIAPVGVGSTHALPGAEPRFRYRGVPTAINPNSGTQARLTVAEAFTLRHVRVTMDVLHPDTSLLEVFLVAPGGQTIELFNLTGRHGENIRHATFDDEAGDHATIFDALPPFTGTHQPDEPLHQLAGTSSSGQWTLLFDNQSSAVGELLDWSLELRAEPDPVTFENYAGALGILDVVAGRQAYALAKPSHDSSAAIWADPIAAGRFELSHWQWTAPRDMSVIYQRYTMGVWLRDFPEAIHITRFPGGREVRRVRFPVESERSYYRVRADFGR